MMDCKKALTETSGDIDKAVELLRVRMGDKAVKLGGREATEGTVQSYIHANGKVGVLVEVDCNTDFVARNEDFVGLRQGDRAAHRRLPATLYVTEDEIPEDAEDAELRVFEQQAADKPEHIRPKIAEGKLKLDRGGRPAQPDARQRRQVRGQDDRAAARELSGTTGENVVIRRFARFAVGE